MARRSLRRKLVVAAIAIALFGIVVFGAGALAIVALDAPDAPGPAAATADDDDLSDEALELLVEGMAIAAPVAMAAAAAVAWTVSRRAMRPLEDAIRAARQTTASDLRRRLPVPARDDELRDLVVAQNELFARLERGFAALAQFAADASHELRTPIAVAATDLEVALRHPRSAAEWEAIARASLDELRRLARVIDGLLTLARAGSSAPAGRPVRVGECVDAVVAQLASAARDLAVTLVGPPAEAADPVVGDPVLLEAAIRNLVENALAAAPTGGRVEVGLAASRDRIAVVVDDDGPGVGPTASRAVAEAARAETPRRRIGLGAGLGLAIATRIAEAHGGAIVAGRSPLGGARFTLSLPRAAPPPLDPAPA